MNVRLMGEFCRLIWALVGFFRPRISLQAEILVLRHQLNVLRRKSPKRSTFSKFDRLIFVGLYGLAPNVLSCVCRKLDSAILVMKAAENRSGCDCADALNKPMNRSIQV